MVYNCITNTTEHTLMKEKQIVANISEKIYIKKDYKMVDTGLEHMNIMVRNIK